MRRYQRRMKRAQRPRSLTSVLRGWIVYYAKKSLWRVPSYYQIQDLVQEGFLCYCKCVVKYPKTKNDAHFAALVKRAFTNRIHDLSRSKQRGTEEPTEPDAEILDTVDPEEATLLVLIGQLPPEAQQLIKVLQSGKVPHREGGPNGLETTNAYLCRLAGIGVVVDMEKLFCEHFQPKKEVSNVKVVEGSP